LLSAKLDKGKPVERQGHKATDLRNENSMIAGLPVQNGSTSMPISSPCYKNFQFNNKRETQNE